MTHTEIDLPSLAPADQYRLLSSTVVPRPIALVSTRSEKGGDNAAPFSFFNVMGEDPPVLVLGLEDKRGSGALKDTTVNIRETGQFVVHLVDEDLARAMSLCSIDFPSGTSEAEALGLTLVDSSVVRPRRIAEAPVAFECERLAIVEVGLHRHIALGRIVRMHVREGLFDADMHYIDPQKYRPVGRLFGRLYTRTRDQFELPVPGYEEWLAEQEKAGAGS